jgi:hypothetical protein
VIRLFLRLYLIVITLVAILFVLTVYVVDNRERFEEQAGEMARDRFIRIIRVLERADASEWPQQIDAMREIYPHDLTLKRVDELLREGGFDSAEERALQRGDIALKWLDADRIGFYQPLVDSPYALADNRQVLGSAHLAFYALILLIASVLAAPLLLFWFRTLWQGMEEIKSVADEIGYGNFAFRRRSPRNPRLPRRAKRSTAWRSVFANCCRIPQTFPWPSRTN